MIPWERGGGYPVFSGSTTKNTYFFVCVFSKEVILLKMFKLIYEKIKVTCKLFFSRYKRIDSNKLPWIYFQPSSLWCLDCTTFKGFNLTQFIYCSLAGARCIQKLNWGELLVEGMGLFFKTQISLYNCWLPEKGAHVNDLRHV